MSNELIERLAREAGMDGDDMRDHPWFVEMVLPRFAALVAERCAQHNEALMREAECEAGPAAAGMLDKACDAIRSAFPMPKDDDQPQSAGQWTTDEIAAFKRRGLSPLQFNKIKGTTYRIGDDRAGPMPKD